MTVLQLSNAPVLSRAACIASAARFRQRRQAFVTIMAIVLMGLIVTSLVAVTAAATADVRRTRQLETDAQFRQLLLAGAADAAAHAKTWGDAAPQSWAMALPEALSERGFRVQVTVLPAKASAEAVAVEVRVEADSQTARRVQALSFTRRGSEWKLGNAEKDR